MRSTPVADRFEPNAAIPPMDIALSVSVAIGAVLSAILFEVPAEIRVDDLSDIPLDSLAELLAAFETPGMESSGIGAKISRDSLLREPSRTKREPQLKK